MKTKEELKALKTEIEAFSKKLAELSEEELKEVVGGFEVPGGGDKNYDPHVYTNGVVDKDYFKQ